jgi:DNA mismatch repair protein MSH5
MTEVFLCFKYEHKKVSVAVYLSEWGRVELSEVWMSSIDTGSISHILLLYSPTVIIASSSVSDSLKQLLLQVNVVYVAKSDFNYQQCKELIISRCYGGDEFLAITSLNFECKDLISCCGALLKFIQNSEMHVHSIQYLNSWCLSVDYNTLQSLQIIKEDAHPSNINLNRSKEGLSVLSVLDNTSTPQGKKKIKEILLRPLNQIDEINQRLDTIQYFINHSPLVYDLISELKSISDLDNIIKKFKEFKHTGNDWAKLLNSLKSFLKISYKTSDLPEKPLIIRTISCINTDNIVNLITLLETCLIFSSDKPHIQAGVSPDLDYLLKIYEELQEFLGQLGDLEKHELKGISYNKVNVIYMQGLGYVIEIQFSAGMIPSKFEIDGYSFLICNDNTLYFKNPRTAALDEKFGDVQGKIKEAENLVLIKLESEVLANENAILLISKCIGDLDAYFSMVLFSESYNLTRPKIFETPRIQIVNGRHILVEMCVDNYIPNDCALDDIHRVAVITGSNNSGKSVYMKTIGIIVYLAHIGSFVPAEVSEIGVCDQIFSRILSSEIRHSSSFAEEISQASVALNNCTPKSLILLDEFGKGTSTLDGMSLIAGLIEELEYKIKATVILTTHYQELITQKYVVETDTVKFYTMEMTESVDENPVFLYKLVRGLPCGSFGLFCAKQAGINEDVIQRALVIRESFRNHQDFKSIKNFQLDKVIETMKLLSKFTAADSPHDFLNKIEDIINNSSINFY